MTEYIILELRKENAMFEPKHHCAKPGCNILLPRNQLFCEKHQIKKNKRTNDKFYKTTFWIKLRQRCLNRDKYICQSCGNFGNIVDHVKPREDGGDDKLYNLQTLCANCHALKTSEDIKKRRIIKV